MQKSLMLGFSYFTEGALLIFALHPLMGKIKKQIGLSKGCREGKELIKYFCQPCVPTKSNGQRTRNLPAHAPDKWLAFKKYNIRDVETEMSIQAGVHRSVKTSRTRPENTAFYRQLPANNTES